jgi:hypothetical protein
MVGRRLSALSKVVRDCFFAGIKFRVEALVDPKHELGELIPRLNLLLESGPIHHVSHLLLGPGNTADGSPTYAPLVENSMSRAVTERGAKI